MTARKPRRTLQEVDHELIAHSPMEWSVQECGGFYHVRAVLDGAQGRRVAQAAARELNRIASDVRRGRK